MKYRWKKSGEDGWDESWMLYLILDGRKHEFADISWNPDVERWSTFVSGFASEESLDIEKTRYELLCDAKSDALNYAKVWWVAGVYQRMSEDERKSWVDCGV